MFISRAEATMNSARMPRVVFVNTSENAQDQKSSSVRFVSIFSETNLASPREDSMDIGSISFICTTFNGRHNGVAGR